MKNNYTLKSYLTILFLCLGFIFNVAQTFEVDGIKYEVSYDNFVKVVKNDEGYSGSVTIPTTVNNNGTTYYVTEIGDNAFYYSTITSIELNEGLISIGYQAFSNSKLTSITLPSTVISIGGSAFHSCYDLTEVTLNEGLSSIGDRAFVDTKITSINIPSTITNIREYTFSSSKLTSVYFHENIQSIGDGAFFMTDLTSIIIPNSVKTIGSSAFMACEKLTSVTLNETITTLNYGVFHGCTSLKSITIPNSIISIGEEALSYTGLTSITLPSSITSIGTSAFSYNYHLTSIILNEGLTTIGSRAFMSSNLRSITLPKSVTNIESLAFSYNYNLVNFISLSTTPPSLESDVFYGNWQEYCDLTVPAESIASYQQTDSWKDFYSINNPTIFDKNNITYQKLKETEIPEVRVVTNSTLYSGEITIPADVTHEEINYNVTKIGNRAFYESYLTSISLPSSITNIGDYAFYDSTKLTLFTSSNTTPPTLGKAVFGYSQNNYEKEITRNWQANCDLYVENNSITDYELEDQWKEFKQILPLSNLSTTDPKLEKIVIYPNPAKDFATISNLKKGANISVFDMSGKLIYQNKTNDKSIKLNTSTYKNGLYLIKIDGQTSKLLIAK